MNKLVSIVAWSIVGLLVSADVVADQLVIRAKTVYTMQGEPLQPGAVLVEDGKIKQVAAQIDTPEGATEIDLGQGVLMPGLVDAYSQTGLVGGDSEVTREVTPELSIYSAIDWRGRAFREALDEGTTSLCLTPGTDNVVAGRAAIIKTAGENRRLRTVAQDAAMVLTMASDPSRGNGSRRRPDSIYVRQPTNRMGVVWILRSTLNQMPESSTSADAPLWAAARGEMPLLAVSRTQFDIQALLTIAEEFQLQPIVVGGHEAYEVAEQLAQRQVAVILTDATTSAIVGAEGTRLCWNQAGVLHQQGVSIALAGGQLLDKARFAVRFGLPADEALKAITLNPARLLAVDDRIGSIAENQDADLVAIDGDPLQPTSRIQWVMVGGKLYPSQ